jgi:hypothetical protein
MNKTLKILSVIFILIFLSISANATEFWGSKNSTKYHYTTCKWAQKINPSNLVKFDSPESAAKSGYSPCKVCKPPTSSKADTNIFAQASIYNVGDEQRRGCCSHHGGVCGCRSGRALCCDGQLSPSCGCD